MIPIGKDIKADILVHSDDAGGVIKIKKSNSDSNDIIHADLIKIYELISKLHNHSLSTKKVCFSKKYWEILSVL